MSFRKSMVYLTAGVLLLFLYLLVKNNPDQHVLPADTTHLVVQKKQAEQPATAAFTDRTGTDNNIPKRKLTEREKYEAFLNNHPYNKQRYSEKEREKKEGKEEEEEEEDSPDRPDLAWEQDFLRTMNPQLKRPTPEVLPNIILKNRQAISAKVQTDAIPGTASTSWVERGPNNVGGRTRALAWDPNDAAGKKVWAGGVTGGLWYTTDITDATVGWTRVDDFWATLAVTAIVFDPNNSQIAYVGTGEGFNVGSGLGAGIWKTTNGGTTWTQLSSTANFSYTNDMIVRNESGVSVIYAAIDGLSYYGTFHNPASAGLQKSSDGGTTWTQVLPKIPGSTVNYVAASINKDANNRIWVGTKASPYAGTDRGGGRVLYSDNGTTWTTADSVIVVNGYGRVTVACAPSDPNYVYSLTENSNKVAAIRKTTNGGASWANVSLPTDADLDIPAADFSRGQAWYGQVLKVDPNSATTLITGSVNLYRSVDAGTTWAQISKWSNNRNMNTLTCSYVHADHHVISFKPGSSTTAVFGNDGGVFYTTAIPSAATSDVFVPRNKNYNVTQFYAAAMHPDIGVNTYLAGAQDNGTQLFSSSGINATTTATGGDGAYCFIDQLSSTYGITSYTNNTYYLTTNSGTSFTTILSDASTGSFINPACYDNNLHILYSYKAVNAIYRIKNITGTPLVSTVTIAGLASNATAFKVSPYTQTSSTVFIGSSSGKLLKVTNADSIPTVTDITGTLPVGSISCIDIGASENELLVTFFNYGISKIWYTQNGGATWVNKSGAFPDIPVRNALFNPNNRTNEVILATELGIYGTTNFASATPTWAASNTGFANVRTDMLQLRNSDYQVVAATYGRGLFSSNGFAVSGVTPPTITSFAPTSGRVGDTITITGTNLSTATNVSFGGTTATSFNIISATSIKAVVGPGNTGTVNVITPGGTAVKPTFTYVSAAPVITSFSPVNAAAGTAITIKGTAFTGATTVAFGGTAAASFTVTSDTTITATVGSGTTGNVTVITPGGTATKSGFTFMVFPVITLNPVSITICSGLNTKFVAAATSSPAYSSQWQVNKGTGFTNIVDGAPYSGALTDTLVITGATTALNGYQYRCLETNALGTATSASAVLTVNAAPATPAISAGGPTSVCSGSSVTLSSSAATLNQWYKDGVIIAGATNATYPATVSGVYTDTVSNAAGCKTGGLQAISVTVNTAPVITLSGAVTFCSGNSVTFTSSSATGNQWYKNGAVIAGATAASFSATASGVYTDTVSVVAGCKSGSLSTTVTVNAGPAAPVVSVTGSLSFCTGGSVLLTSSSATLNQWYKDGTIIANATGSSYTATASGAYTDSVSNAGGCKSGSTSNTVTVIAFPAIPVITPGGAFTLCSGSTVSLGSSASSGNQWYKDGAILSGATNANYTASVAGVYTDTVTNSGGCKTGSAGTTIISGASPATPILGASGSTTFCSGGSVILSSSATANNQWYNNGVIIAAANGTSFTATTSGTYTDTVTNSNGCKSGSAGIAVNAIVVPTPTITQQADTLISSAATGNQWYLNTNTITGATNQKYKILNTGTYTVQVTGTNNCLSAMSANFPVVITATGNITTNSTDWKLYPNPVTGGILFIRRAGSNSGDGVTAQITTAEGRLAGTKTLSSTGGAWNIASLPAGVYYLRITDNKAIYIYQFIKQ